MRLNNPGSPTCQQVIARPGRACCKAEVSAVTRRVNPDLHRRGLTTVRETSAGRPLR